jgi:hypothetical protein
MLPRNAESCSRKTLGPAKISHPRVDASGREETKHAGLTLEIRLGFCLRDTTPIPLEENQDSFTIGPQFNETDNVFLCSLNW